MIIYGKNLLVLYNSL